MFQTDLLLCSPICPNQEVILYGDWPEIEVALLREKVKLKVGKSDGLQNPTATQTVSIVSKPKTADHIIVPCLTPILYTNFPKPLIQNLKSGGWLLVSFFNAQSLHRFRFWRTRKLKSAPEYQPITLNQFRSALKSSGLTTVAIYGLYLNPNQPQTFIPLNNPTVLRYYFNNLFVPVSWFGKFISQAASLFIALGAQHVLFEYLIVLASDSSTLQEIV